MASEQLTRKIEDAARDIQASGKYPSVDRVREALGNHGSKRDIVAVLKTWRMANHEGGPRKTTPEIPSFLANKISELVVQYAEVCSVKQRKEYHDALQAMEDEFFAIIRDKERIADSLTIELHQTKEELRKVREELREMENRFHRLLGKNDVKSEFREMLASLKNELSSQKV